MKEKDIPTDRFSTWLQEIRQARITEKGMDVPCGNCRACCTSSYFIYIRPDEIETLARIPKELQFAAPFLPKGHIVLGYDEKGHCPMFVENECSIYAVRPQTCCDFDCRVFSVTGLPVDENKPEIARQAFRWKFEFPEERDHSLFNAVQRAATFLKEHATCLPIGIVTKNTTNQAVIALLVYEVFLDFSAVLADDGSAEQIQKIANAIIEAYKKFEAARMTYKNSLEKNTTGT